MIRFTAIAALATFGPGLCLASAQDESDRGPFAYDAVGVSRPKSNAPSSLDNIFIKPSGDQTIAPQVYSSAPSSAFIPDFRASAMFDAAYLSVLDIDALSTGNDWLPVEEGGEIDPNTTSVWHSLMFTVKNSAQGLPGGVLYDRKAQGKNVGGDIYNYFFPGSVGIEPELIDQVLLSQATTHIGLGDAPDEIDAIDFQLPKIVADLTGSDEFIICRNRIYFSITQASAAAILSQGTLKKPFLGLSSSDISGRHVYGLAWRSQTQTWDATVDVIIDLAQASALPLSTNDDVDAIAIDSHSSTVTPIILFSTADVSRVQIQVAQVPPGTSQYAVYNITTNSGDPVIPKLKIASSDNVNGMCGLDPHNTTSYGKAFCTPVRYPLYSNYKAPVLHLSTSISTGWSNPDAKNQVGITLSGWSSSGPSEGLVLLDVLLYPSMTSYQLGPFSRNESQNDMTWVIPINYSALLGQTLLTRAEYATTAGWVHTSYVDFLAF